ncbi:MAG TPA: CDP-alcohol phosphatidyltransferase family protein [Thermoleophilaceae bacterium]|nr:CDP-alcohol phosphatidyltransferase family protein [Thermoleophilaceae bacterium]
MATELQRPPQRKPPIQLSGNITTAVLVATAPGDEGGPAAALPWEGGNLLDRALGLMAELGLRDVHVITRPQYEDALRASAEAAGAALRVCADPSRDLAEVAELAAGASGGFVVLHADVIVQRGALEGLLANPGIASGVLGAGQGGGGGMYALRGRLARGRLVSASSAYHSVSQPRMTFLGVLKVAARDIGELAEAAEELSRLMEGGPPPEWRRELDNRVEGWRMSLGRTALKAERRSARDALQADGRERGELPALEPNEYARRRRELARELPGPEESDLRLRVTALEQDIVSLLLVGLVRSKVHLGNTFVRGFFWTRALTRAATEQAAVTIHKHDEERVKLKSAVKGADGFFTTFFVSTWSRYVSRWLGRRGVSPNHVTIFALCLGLAAATAFATGERTGYVVGAVLVYFSFVFDCVDGQVARYTRRYSKFGAYLDSVFDRTKEYAAFAGLAIGASSSEVWIMAAAMLTLQTFRHFFDFSFGATDRQAIAETPQPSIAQAPDEALGRLRMKSRGTLEPKLGALEHREATAAEVREAAEDEEDNASREPKPPRPKSLSKRILGFWRVLDRVPGLIWLKKMAAFPIGERFAVICITAALFSPRVTFITLLAWGSFALLYTTTGRTLRTLAKWRSLPG